MTDDQWRRRNDDDFGPPLFGDEPTNEHEVLSFDDDSAAMPHWTEPATGQLPRTDAVSIDDTDDLDVWSSFSGQAVDTTGGTSRQPEPSGAFERGGYSGLDDDITGLAPVFGSDDTATGSMPITRDITGSTTRETGRITIGTDPTDDSMQRPPLPPRRGRPLEPGSGRAVRGPGAPGRAPGTRAASGAPTRKGMGRDMPTAIAVGLAIAAVFILAIKYRPWAVAAIVVIVLALAAVEYFERVRDKGYQPAHLPGVVACAAAPLATYHYGTSALPIVLALVFGASALTYVASNGLESGPMHNMSITMLGVVWIGALGSFGGAILHEGNALHHSQIGTDTLCLLAIAVVANDVGALFIGSAVGNRPLRQWISPNKSVEGFVGGTVVTIGAMFLVSIANKSTTWNSLGDLLLLGIVVSLVAPLGDLTESMFKRELDVKDFGSIVKGHGGILDRFDAFLFAMPAVYFLLVSLHPWVTK